jgi:hypothetical protein
MVEEGVQARLVREYCDHPVVISDLRRVEMVVVVSP